MRRSTLRVAVIAGAGLFALAFVLRTFVGGVYRVESPSMEPIVHGSEVDGDRLLVAYGGAAGVERFELVVVRRPNEPVPLVKRVVGLPGERVLLSGGDLLVNGRRLPPGVPRPEPVLVFDDSLLALGDHFHLRLAPEGPWSIADGVVRLNGASVDPGSDLGMALYSDKLTDGWLAEDGRREPGVHQVNDALLECELRWTANPAASGGLARLRLLEAGDSFEVELDPAAGTAKLTRRTGSAGLEALVEEAVELPSDTWIPLVFANVDDALWLDVNGERLFTLEYDGNHSYPGDPPMGVPDRDAWRTRAVGPAVGFGGEGLALEYRRVRILRDLHYFPQGTHAVERPVSLGPGELFLLGDNSAHSRDGRHWGPVRQDAVLGRPVAVVWPRARWRTLSGRLESESGRAR